WAVVVGQRHGGVERGGERHGACRGSVEARVVGDGGGDGRRGDGGGRGNRDRAVIDEVCGQKAIGAGVRSQGATETAVGEASDDAGGGIRERHALGSDQTRAVVG